MSIEHLIIGDTKVEVHRGKIKNMHVGVYPPDGRVRVAAPEVVSLDAIRVAVLMRMPWIRRKQTQFAQQERQSPRQYVSGETHYVLGRPYRLEVTPWEKNTHKITKRSHDRLRMLVPQDHSRDARGKWMKKWLRSGLRDVAAPRIKIWSERLGVSPKTWGIRSMKTKWGSCNPEKAIIWLNEELAQKPVEAIDYVILHELAHLISSRHDDKFVGILDAHQPQWRQVRTDLNQLPLSAWKD